MGEKLGYYALKLFKWLVNILPEKISYYLAIGLGTLLFYLVRDRRKLGIKNIKQALNYSDEKAAQITKEVFQDLALKTVEVLRVEGWTEEDFKNKIEVEGWENFKQAYERDKGIILFTGHFGNWEIMGLYFSVLGYPLNALAKRRDNPFISEEIWRIRESRGATVLDYKREVKSAFKALLKGELLLILGDQDAHRRGEFVQFFHKLASTPKGPVVLAEKAGGLILPVYLVREELGKYKLFIEPSLEVADDMTEGEKKEVLQTLTFSLEDKVRGYPEQWLWLHRRWKTEPEEAGQ